LMIFVYHRLMVFVYNIFVLFMYDVLMMLVDDILMVLLNNWSLFVLFKDGFVLMSDDFCFSEFFFDFKWFIMFFNYILFMGTGNYWMQRDLLTGAGIKLLVTFRTGKCLLLLCEVFSLVQLLLCIHLLLLACIA